MAKEILDRLNKVANNKEYDILIRNKAMYLLWKYNKKKEDKNESK